MATFSYPDLQNYPQRVPLIQALSLPTATSASTCTTTVGDLGLSVRPSNCLAKCNIVGLDQLMALTIADLYEIPAMGHKSVQEIVQCVSEFFARDEGVVLPPKFPIERQYTVRKTPLDAEWIPLKLVDEWSVYSFGIKPPSIPLSELSVLPELGEILAVVSCDGIDELLEWTWETTTNRLGTEPAEELLECLLTLAQDRREVRESSRAKELPDFDTKRRLLD